MACSNSNNIIKPAISLCKPLAEGEEPPIKHDLGNVNTGGMSNIIHLPIALYTYVKNIFEGVKNQDIGSIFEFSLLTLNIPTGMLLASNSIFYMIAYITHTTAIFALGILSIPFFALFSIIETVVEIYRLLRVIDFSRKLNLSDRIKLIKKLSLLEQNAQSEKTAKKVNSYIVKNKNKLIPILGETSFKNLSNICTPSLPTDRSSELLRVKSILVFNTMVFLQKKHLSIDTPLITNTPDAYKKAIKYKTDKLAQKIGANLTKILTEELSSNTSGEPNLNLGSIKRGIELIKKIDHQQKKVQLVHIIGLSVLAIGVISFILFSLSIPLFIPFLVTSLTFVGVFIRSVIGDVYVETEGNTFNLRKALPVWLIKCFDKCKTQSIPFPLNRCL